MRWPLLLFVGWFAIFPRVIWAEELGGRAAPPDRPALTSESIPRLALIHQNPAANFHLTLGRLQLDPVRYRKGSQTLLHTAVCSADSSPQNASSEAPAEPAISETIHINSVHGSPILHYSMTGADVQIMIEAEGRGPWRIESRRTRQGSTSRVLVQQIPNEPIVLQYFSADSVRTIRAATWLHLREADRAIYAEFLEPIVDELLWPYRLSELADAAHQQSLEPSIAAPISDATLAAWIDDLRSPSRATRMMADRRLTGVGISLLPRLADIDESRLDAEQRHRLRKIQTKLSPRGEDGAARLAHLIRDDFAYWQFAAHRLSANELHLVDSRFERLGSDVPSLRADDSSRIASEAPASRMR